MDSDLVAGIIRRHYEDRAAHPETSTRITIEGLVSDLAPLTGNPREFHLQALGHLDVWLDVIAQDEELQPERHVKGLASTVAAVEAHKRSMDWRRGHRIGEPRPDSVSDHKMWEGCQSVERGLACTEEDTPHTLHLAYGGEVLRAMWDGDHFESAVEAFKPPRRARSSDG